MTQAEINHLKEQRGRHVARKLRFERLRMLTAAARETKAIHAIDLQLKNVAANGPAAVGKHARGPDRYATMVITPGNAGMLFQHYAALVHQTPITQAVLRAHYVKRRNLARRTMRKGDRIGRRASRRAVRGHRRMLRQNAPLLRRKAKEQRQLAKGAAAQRRYAEAAQHNDLAKKYEDQAIQAMVGDKYEDGSGESMTDRVATMLRKVAGGDDVESTSIMLPSEARRAAEEGLPDASVDEDESEVPEDAASGDESFLSKYKWWLLGGGAVLAVALASPKGKAAARSLGIKLSTSKPASPFGKSFKVRRKVA